MSNPTTAWRITRTGIVLVAGLSFAGYGPATTLSRLAVLAFLAGVPSIAVSLATAGLIVYGETILAALFAALLGLVGLPLLTRPVAPDPPALVAEYAYQGPTVGDLTHMQQHPLRGPPCPHLI